jgi:hypothetical protein
MTNLFYYGIPFVKNSLEGIFDIPSFNILPGEAVGKSKLLRQPLSSY